MRENKEWTLSIDGSSNQRESGAGVVLEGSSGVLIEQSLCFDFRASNNQAEYGALLTGIQLVKEVGAKMLTVKSIGRDLGGIHSTLCPQEQNERTDLLAKLAKTEVLCNEWKSSWQDPIIDYLNQDKVLKKPQEARKIKRDAIKCLNRKTIKTKWSELLKKFMREHVEATLVGGPWEAESTSEEESALMSRYKFGQSVGQVKFLLVAIDYFTKWIEVELVATISAERVKQFYWKRIICRFGLPTVIISDNGTQFASQAIAEFCAQYGIKQSFTCVEHPQSNGCKGMMGRRVATSTLVLSHRTTLDYPRNPISLYLWNRCNDPSGGRRVVAMH
ncbi:putative protein K02A2.6, partial [Mucuna pruriens]